MGKVKKPPLSVTGEWISTRTQTISKNKSTSPQYRKLNRIPKFKPLRSCKKQLLITKFFEEHRVNKNDGATGALTVDDDKEVYSCEVKENFDVYPMKTHDCLRNVDVERYSRSLALDLSPTKAAAPSSPTFPECSTNPTRHSSSVQHALLPADPSASNIDFDAVTQFFERNVSSTLSKAESRFHSNLERRPEEPMTDARSGSPEQPLCRNISTRQMVSPLRKCKVSSDSPIFHRGRSGNDHQMESETSSQLAADPTLMNSTRMKPCHPILPINQILGDISVENLPPYSSLSLSDSGHHAAFHKEGHDSDPDGLHHRHLNGPFTRDCFPGNSKIRDLMRTDSYSATTFYSNGRTENPSADEHDPLIVGNKSHKDNLSQESVDSIHFSESDTLLPFQPREIDTNFTLEFSSQESVIF